MERTHSVGCVPALLLFAAPSARAQPPLTFTGTFAHDDSLFVDTFAVTSAAQLHKPVRQQRHDCSVRRSRRDA